MKVHSRITKNNNPIAVAEEASTVSSPQRVLRALFCTVFAATTLSLGWSIQTAFASNAAQGETPPVAPIVQPTVAPVKPAVKKVVKPKVVATVAPVAAAAVPAGSLRVKIIACVDVNRDKVCLPDEARVPGVAIMVGDQVFATGNTGEIEVVIPANSQVEFTPPDNYKDADNNYRKQLLSGGRLDLPLVVGTAVQATVAPAPVQGIEVKLPDNFMQPIVNLDVDLRPVYIGLAAIGGVILLGYLLLGGSLRGIKRVYQSSLAKQDAALGDQHTRELAVRLQMQQGWQQIAEQLIADAVSEIISVDGDAGVLDATATPTPKFTVVARDGREFIFTVNPKILKKMRLVKPGDRIVNITNVSATSRMDVQALWDYIVRSRNMWSATPPSKAEWYVVVRQSNRGVGVGQYKLGSRATAQIGRP